MATFFVNLMRWPRRLLWWLLRVRLALFCAAVVILALVASLAHFQSEPSIRISGMLLQLLGISAAAVGIRDTRRMFGKPSFLQLARNWLQSVPGIKTKVVAVNLSPANMSFSATAKAHPWHGAGQEPTIESRLSAAESNLLELYNRASAAESVFDNHVRAAKQSLQEEKNARTEEDRQLHLKIQAASTDGLHLAAVGAVWLASGVIMSSIPNELLCLVA